jgi:hypothetical protein
VSRKLGEPTGAAPRNHAITLIGWVYIAFGILAALGGVIVLLMTLLMAVPYFFALIAATQLIVGAAMIAGGTAFLGLRAWARTLLETLAWLGLLYNIAFAVLWVGFLMPKFHVPSRDALMLPAMTVLGLTINIGFCAALVFIISILRGPAVRSAITAASA